MSLGTKQAIVDRINNVEVLGDKDYDWVWDYAKFRFGYSTSAANGAEEKAESLLKFSLSVAGAFWVLFIYLATQLSMKPRDIVNGWLVCGLVFIGFSALSALVAIFPITRRALFREDAAIRFVNAADTENAKEPIGRFAVGLMLCSDSYQWVARFKSYCVATGLVFLVAAASLITFGFYSSVSRIRFPSSNRQPQTESSALREHQGFPFLQSLEADLEFSGLVSPSVDCQPLDRRALSASM